VRMQSKPNGAELGQLHVSQMFMNVQDALSVRWHETKYEAGCLVGQPQAFASKVHARGPTPHMPAFVFRTVTNSSASSTLPWLQSGSTCSPPTQHQVHARPTARGGVGAWP
jgi:hypothetical protein